jgi:hypothetical protein
VAYRTGELESGALRLDFDHRLMIQYRGSEITSDGALLAYRKLMHGVIQRIHRRVRDVQYWAMAWGMGAMGQQVCVVLSAAEREQLAAIAADRSVTATSSLSASSACEWHSCQALRGSACRPGPGARRHCIAHPKVLAWLTRHPRWTFTPTSVSCSTRSKR